MGADAAGLAELVSEVRRVGAEIAAGDTKYAKRMDALESSLNELFKRYQRPGADNSGAANDNEQKNAAELCILKHNLTTPKDDGLGAAYVPSASEIETARTYRRGLRSMWRHGDPNKLDGEIRKSLSSFAFGSNAFIMPPELASQTLSCLADPTDVAGMVNVVQISAGSAKFFIDNVRLNIAAWACQASCFANNPQPDLAAGLGEMEIKAEALRFTACVGGDLLQDAAFNLESWILRKVSDGFRNSISEGIIAGDGIGKPSGLLHPNSGIPILDTSLATPAGTFTWQDLVQLKFDVPMQWHNGGAYYCNQRTLGLLCTMSDALGRPLLQALPSGMPPFAIAGSPIIVVTQMPDCLPGNTPILYGNLRQAYTLVQRSGTVMTPDPFSAGFCVLYKFEARVGGAVTCGNAARLLRIR